MLHVIFALVLSEMVREWRIIFATYMHLNNCFKCKVCTNKTNSLVNLKSHIFCNHARKSEISQRQVLAFQMILDAFFCTSILWTVVRMKTHIHCLHASKPGYTQKQLWYFNGLNAMNTLKGSILWVLWGTIFVAIMTVLKMIQKAAPLAGVHFLHFFFQKFGWWTVKKSENKPNSAQKIILF